MTEQQQIDLFAEMLDEREQHYSMTASAYEVNPEHFGSSPENAAVWRMRAETVKRIREDFIKYFGAKK